jgi:hypothetical protein
MATIKKAQTGAGVPKGYVRGEMTGKLIKKSVQDKWETGMADALDKQAGKGKYAPKPAKPAAKPAKPKAKDGKWIQKVSKSIKARGTEGKCTPITKPGCTGKAKSLAKTFKKMAKARKKK